MFLFESVTPMPKKSLELPLPEKYSVKTTTLDSSSPIYRTETFSDDSDPTLPDATSDDSDPPLPYATSDASSSSPTNEGSEITEGSAERDSPIDSEISVESTEAGVTTSASLARAPLQRYNELMQALSLGLLKDPQDLNKPLDNGYTLLMEAVECDLMDDVIELLSNQADPNIAGPKNRTPLHLAAKNGAIFMVDQLLASGANPTVRDNKLAKPADYAADHKSIREVLVEAELLKAVEKNLIDTVAESLSAGTDPNTCGLDGKSVLHLACENGSAPIVRMLVQAKANINTTNSSEVTPLQCATLASEPAIVKILLDGKAEVNSSHDLQASALHHAVGNNDKLSVHYLLEAKANVNQKDDSGFSPLHAAAFSGQEGLITSLLEVKADVNATDDNQETPLHKAAYQGFYSTVLLLLNNKANPQARNIVYQTPYDCARERGYSGIMELLTPRPAHKLPLITMPKQSEPAPNSGSKLNKKRGVSTLYQSSQVDVDASKKLKSASEPQSSRKLVFSK